MAQGLRGRTRENEAVPVGANSQGTSAAVHDPGRAMNPSHNPHLDCKKRLFSCNRQPLPVLPYHRHSDSNWALQVLICINMTDG